MRFITKTLISLLCGLLAFYPYAYAGDVEVKLTTNDSMTTFDVMDSDGTVIFQIDSDGNTSWPEGGDDSDLTVPEVTDNPETLGIVAPKGSIAFDSTGNQLYVNVDGNTDWEALTTAGVSNNFYTADGTLTTGRIVTMDGNNIQFDGSMGDVFIFDDGGLTAEGDLQVGGNTTLGDDPADTVTINGTVQGGSPLVFEGDTDDGNDLTFVITDPTAPRTITFPDADGTIALAGDVPDVLNDLDDVDTTGLDHGSILFHDGTDWVVLPATGTTAGQVLQTGGVGVDPSWATITGTLPPGVNPNDTLYWDGTDWMPSSALQNDNTNITVAGDLNVNGGDIITDQTNLNITTDDGGTVNFTDGANNLVTITDQGTTGDLTVTGDVAVNGGDLTTTSNEGNLFNTGAEIANIGGDADTVSIGDTAGGGTTTINNDLNVAGDTTLDGSVTLGDDPSDPINVTGTIQGGSPLVFDGATPGGNTTTFVFTDPTMNNTITFPDGSGTIALAGDIPENLDDLDDVDITGIDHGSVLYRNGSNEWVVLPAGMSGQFLQTTGTGSDPVWASSSGTSIYADDGMLDGDRVVDLDGNTLTFRDNFDITIDDGNIKVGDGVNQLPLNGEDVYIEGTLEVDGTAQLDGDVNIAGNTTIDGNTTIGDAPGDTVTIGGTIQGANPFVFEGTSDDGNDLTFAITNPTAPRTITFPDADGIIALAGDVPDTLDDLNDVGVSDTSAGFMLVGGGAGTFESVEIDGDIDVATDGTVTIQTDAVDGTNISITGEANHGDIAYFNGTDWVVLSAPVAGGDFLKTNGQGSAPEWDMPGGGGTVTDVGDCSGSNCFTADGDGNTLIFEGPTPNANEVTLTAPDTAGDITVTLPNTAGTLALDSDIPDTLDDLDDVDNSTPSAGFMLVGNGTDFDSVEVDGDIDIATDGTVTIQDNSVDGTDIALGSDTIGDIMYYDGTNWVRLAAGALNEVLTAQGAAAPQWGTAPGSVPDGNAEGQTLRWDDGAGEWVFSNALLNDGTDLTASGDLAVNGGDITSSGNLTINSGGGTVDIQDAVMVDSLNVDSGDITLEEGETISNSVDGVVQIGVPATGSLTVDTGNFVVGDGTGATLPLNGVDGFVEGTFEVDGATQLDGGLTSAGDTVLGDSVDDNVTINGGIQGLNALQFEGATDDGTNITTFQITDPTAPRTIVFPDASGTVTLKEDFRIFDTSQDHEYIVTVNELTDNRNIELPLLGADDTFVFEDFTQTLSNKTLADPIITTRATFDNEATARFESGTDGEYVELKAPTTLTDDTTFTLVLPQTDITNDVGDFLTLGAAGQLEWSGSSASNIYNADDMLTADRTMDMNNFNLTFNGDVDVVIDEDVGIGVGTATPDTTLDVDGTVSITPAAGTHAGGGAMDADDGSVIRVSGGGTVSTINNGNDGQLLTVIGTDNGSKTTFNNAGNISLDRNVTFAVGDGDMLLLMYDGVNMTWNEIKRANN